MPLYLFGQLLLKAATGCATTQVLCAAGACEITSVYHCLTTAVSKVQTVSLVRGGPCLEYLFHRRALLVTAL